MKKLYSENNNVKLVHSFEGKLFYLNTEGINPQSQSYYWDRHAIKDKIADDLVKITQVEVLFPVTGYHGFFKPSEQEVNDIVARLQHNYNNEIYAFEIPEQNLTLDNITNDYQYHQCKVNIYKRLPQDETTKKMNLTFLLEKASRLAKEKVND